MLIRTMQPPALSTAEIDNAILDRDTAQTCLRPHPELCKTCLYLSPTFATPSNYCVSPLWTPCTPC